MTSRISSVKTDINVKRDQLSIYGSFASLQKEKSLAVLYPNLKKEWNYKRNDSLLPTQVLPSSHRKVWWLLPYDDPKSGKHFDFEWQAEIKSRVNGSQCPYLTNQKIFKGFNDAATLHPELIIFWHPTLNGSLKLEDISPGYDSDVFWIYKYTDPETNKTFTFEWKSKIRSMLKSNCSCPFLSGKIFSGFNDLKTKQPSLCEEWDYSKNTIDPGTLSPYSHEKVFWKCKTCGNEWKAAVSSRTYNHGCPVCGRNKSIRNRKHR